MDTTMLKPGSAQALMQLVRRMLLEVNTAIPGEIIAFNPALQTFTAATDAVPFLDGTGVDNLEVGIAAGGTFHGVNLLSGRSLPYYTILFTICKGD